MNQRQAILWRTITANARRIAPMVPTVARKALVATTLPETTRKAPQGTFPRQSTEVDYDASTADEWNQWVMRGV